MRMRYVNGTGGCVNPMVNQCSMIVQMGGAYRDHWYITGMHLLEVACTEVRKIS